jgi:hypothetical protein|tara:strand:- start:338 stop:544 length:207 start_codon:yes stop_codon:yes gene_type:complete
MKKEWMYFIAGAGLMAVILVALDPNNPNKGYSSYEECNMEELRKIPHTKPTSALAYSTYDYCLTFDYD